MKLSERLEKEIIKMSESEDIEIKTEILSDHVRDWLSQRFSVAMLEKWSVSDLWRLIKKDFK